jgi:hypothetical protein
VAFAVSFLATLYVLLPNRNLYFALDSRLLHRILRDGGDLQDAHRRLSTWALDLYERNGAALDLLHWAYRLAALGLAAQVLSWSAGAVLDL